MNASSSSVTFDIRYQPFQIPHLPVRVGDLPTPLFQNAVNEFAMTRGCGPEFGYLSALAAISIASQNLFDVRTPDGHSFPCSLMLLGCGGPASGKSAAAKYFLQSIEQYEEAKADLFPAGGFIYKDTTGAALFAGLAELPAAALVSCEGSEILFGIVREHYSALNSLWSGEPVRIRRRTRGNFIIRNGRSTMLALSHMGQVQKLLRGSGSTLAEVGLLARLVTFNATANPFPTSQEASPEPHRAEFLDRITELLTRNMDAALEPSFSRELMEFDPIASRTWLKYSAQLKADGKPGGRFELAPEHAARLPENVARIAALLHVFERHEGAISDSSLYSAIAICEEASLHYMATFVPDIHDELEASELDAWLTDRFRSRFPKPVKSISRVTLLRRGPNRMRDYAILKPLIAILVGRGCVSEFKRNGSWKIDLFPWESQQIGGGTAPGGRSSV